MISNESPYFDTTVIKIPQGEFSEYKNYFNSNFNLKLIILACINQNHGELWKKDLPNNQIVVILVTESFSALAGDFSYSKKYYGDIFDKIKKHTLILTDCKQTIEKVHSFFGFRFVHRKNLRFSFESNNLSIKYLLDLRGIYSNKYDYSAFKIRKISPSDLNNLSNELLEYFNQFMTPEELTNSLLCYVAIDTNGKVVSISGAGHQPINNHYEVQIATEKTMRKKGLSMMVTIEHLIYALENGFIPHWDAASELSASMAEKLGYGSRNPYDGYFYTNFLIKILRISRIPKLVVIILRKLGKI